MTEINEFSIVLKNLTINSTDHKTLALQKDFNQTSCNRP